MTVVVKSVRVPTPGLTPSSPSERNLEEGDAPMTLHFPQMGNGFRRKVRARASQKGDSYPARRERPSSAEKIKSAPDRGGERGPMYSQERLLHPRPSLSFSFSLCHRNFLLPSSRTPRPPPFRYPSCSRMTSLTHRARARPELPKPTRRTSTCHAF